MKNTRFNTYMRLLVLVLLFGQVSDLALCSDEGGQALAKAGNDVVVHSDAGSGHSGTNSNSQQSKDYDCPCVCHLIFDCPNLPLYDAQITVISHVTIESSSYDFSSINTIDHPPTV